MCWGYHSWSGSMMACRFSWCSSRLVCWKIPRRAQWWLLVVCLFPRRVLLTRDFFVRTKSFTPSKPVRIPLLLCSYTTPLSETPKLEGLVQNKTSGILSQNFRDDWGWAFSEVPKTSYSVSRRDLVVCICRFIRFSWHKGMEGNDFCLFPGDKTWLLADTGKFSDMWTHVKKRRHDMPLINHAPHRFNIHLRPCAKSIFWDGIFPNWLQGNWFETTNYRIGPCRCDWSFWWGLALAFEYVSAREQKPARVVFGV